MPAHEDALVPVDVSLNNRDFTLAARCRGGGVVLAARPKRPRPAGLPALGKMLNFETHTNSDFEDVAMAWRRLGGERFSSTCCVFGRVVGPRGGRGRTHN